MKIEINQTWKNLLFFSVCVALIVVALGLFVYDSNIVQPGIAKANKDSGGEVGPLAVGVGRFTTIYGTLGTAAQPNVTSVGSLSTATITTATITSLSLGGQTQSGAVRYGTASSYASGASIAHGFTVTPTVCMINPNQSITATYTITSTGFSSDMVDTASPIYWLCGK